MNMSKPKVIIERRGGTTPPHMKWQAKKVDSVGFTSILTGKTKADVEEQVRKYW